MASVFDLFDPSRRTGQLRLQGDALDAMLRGLLGTERRATIIHAQTLVATCAPERAIETLPTLLPDPAERALALGMVRHTPGEAAEMSERTVALLDRSRKALDLPALIGDVLSDPLAAPAAVEPAAGVAPAAGPAAVTVEVAPVGAVPVEAAAAEHAPVEAAPVTAPAAGTEDVPPARPKTRVRRPRTPKVV